MLSLRFLSDEEIGLLRFDGLALSRREAPIAEL